MYEFTLSQGSQFPYYSAKRIYGVFFLFFSYSPAHSVVIVVFEKPLFTEFTFSVHAHTRTHIWRVCPAPHCCIAGTSNNSPHTGAHTHRNNVDIHGCWINTIMNCHSHSHSTSYAFSHLFSSVRFSQLIFIFVLTTIGFSALAHFGPFQSRSYLATAISCLEIGKQCQRCPKYSPEKVENDSRSHFSKRSIWRTSCGEAIEMAALSIYYQYCRTRCVCTIWTTYEHWTHAHTSLAANLLRLSAVLRCKRPSKCKTLSSFAWFFFSFYITNAHYLRRTTRTRTHRDIIIIAFDDEISVRRTV